MNKKKKKISIPDLIADKIAWLMGSWWGIFFHIFWWVVWWLAGWSVSILTLWLSVEAILICIFILMVQNRAEEDQAALMELYNKTEMEVVGRDLKLAERADRRQLEIVKEIRRIGKEVESLKKKLSK